MLLDLSLRFYSFIPSLIRHGTKSRRNLEGCSDKELCYDEKGVVAMLTDWLPFCTRLD